MQQVVLKALEHRGAVQIGIYFPRDRELEVKVRSLTGVRWSRTHRCWYVPFTPSIYAALAASLKDIAIVNQDALKAYAENSQKKIVTVAVPPKPQSNEHSLQKVQVKYISAANLKALEQFVEHLKLKAYSESTIRTYRNEFMQLLQVLGEIEVSRLEPDHLKRYLLYCVNQGLSENTLHSRLNALKFYFEQVLKREKFFWEIPRPKKPIKLPNFFNREEIAAIINATGNIKHKAMLMLAYSAGLRVSEVVALRTHDIDSKRMTILVRQAKGKKDRMAALSPVLLVILREYARHFKPEKNGYLFQGNSKGEPYSTRSLQEVLRAAKDRAGVLKPGSVHSLRHSFATHLIDRGTDVTMIQKLLGHNDLKTTLRYLHTSNKDLLKIVSPLDDLPL